MDRLSVFHLTSWLKLRRLLRLRNFFLRPNSLRQSNE